MSLININIPSTKSGQIIAALAIFVYLVIVLWLDDSSKNEHVMAQQLGGFFVMCLAALAVLFRLVRQHRDPQHAIQLRNIATVGAGILLISWAMSRIWFLLRRVFLELQMTEYAGLITTYTPQFNGLHYIWLVLACGMLAAPWLFEKFGSWWIIVTSFIGVFSWHISLIIAGLI